MHAAACLGANDCWFGGGPLEEPLLGSFHLHWNGSSLEEQPEDGEGNAVEDMLALEGRIYESVLLARSDRGKSSAPSVIHRIAPEGAAATFEAEEGIFEELPETLYEAGESPRALDFLHLASAGLTGPLWVAASQNPFELIEPPGRPGQVTLARSVKRSWTQLIGPQRPLGPILASHEEEAALLGGPAANARVSALAAEPGSGDVWLALSPPEESSAAKGPQRAVLLHISAEGAVLGEATLPSAAEEAQGVGPKGAATKLSCPAREDCWLATTQGWLFHLAPPDQRTLPVDPGESEYFHGLITYRPADQGLPQVTPDAPPEDDSGLREEAPEYGGKFAETKATNIQTEAKVAVPLLSALSSRLLHGSTLQLSFHLAVKARVRLIAKRGRAVVASTPSRTLAAGSRKLLLRLDPKRWPTKLSLQTHALAALPTTGSRSPSVGTISTGEITLPHDLSVPGTGLLN